MQSARKKAIEIIKRRGGSSALMKPLQRVYIGAPFMVFVMREASFRYLVACISFLTWRSLLRWAL
jgi:hypothetical protein